MQHIYCYEKCLIFLLVQFKTPILFFCPASIFSGEMSSMKEEHTEDTMQPFNYDVVDVSKGFLTRIPYKKKVKFSKLDSLLERRLKQHIVEERQRQRESNSNPQTPTPASSASTSILSTPVRPRTPLKPHTLVQTQLALGEVVKVEKPSKTETPLPGEVGGQEVPSPAPPGSTPKNNCSAGTGEDSASPQNQFSSLGQESEGDLLGRTMGPKETNSDSSGQEGVQDTTAGGTCRSLETQTESEVPNLKLDLERTSAMFFEQKSSRNTSQFKLNQENTETSVHSGAEENGMGPVEKQESTQGVGLGRTEGDSTLKPVSPLPQVNGNDGPGSDGMLSKSVMSSNNGVLINSPQPKMNSYGKLRDQELVVSLKDSTQQKPLINGDVAPVNDSTEVEAKEPSLASKTEVDSKRTSDTSIRPGSILDQDYKPPLKTLKVENNIDALEANTDSTRQHNSKSLFQSVETNAAPVFKIIRMAPSPIPSAEESSLSDDFPEESSQSGITEPLKTIIAQVTTTSTTTTTTTVVSKETRVVKAPSMASGEILTPMVSTSESSAVSTLTTMTKTTVTKICSPSLDGHSEDSQSEIVTQEDKTAMSVLVSKTSVLSAAVSQEDCSSTKGRVRLLKFSRTKKTRSDTALPSYRKFVTKSNHKSIFVLPYDELKVLGRRGGFREVPIFSYNAKPAWDIWPYPSPRPTFGITWR